MTNEGNNFMKKGKFEEALDMYSKVMVTVFNSPVHKTIIS